MGARLTLAGVVVLALASCGAPVRDAPAVAVSSWRDPPPRSPAPDPLPEAGDEPTGALALGGAEAARALVVDLLAAIRAGDAAAAEATLSERVESAAPPRAGVPRTAVDRAQLVRHWLTLARSARVEPSLELASLVARESIVVEPAPLHYAPSDLPPGVEAGDLVVRFTVTGAGVRAFAGLAPGGEGLFVVRPGAEPRIVAR